MNCLLIPGVGVIPEDYVQVRNLFLEHGENLKILDSREILNKKKWDSNSLVDAINSFNHNTKIDYLIGVSLGGAVAIEYALNCPKKVNNLVLISPHLKQIDNYFIKIIHRLSEASDQNVKSGFSLKGVLTFIGRYLSRLKIIKKELSLIGELNFFKNDFLLFTKTFFLLGELDKTCPIKNYQAIKSKFINHTLTLIPNVGHEWSDDLGLLEENIKKIGIFR